MNEILHSIGLPKTLANILSVLLGVVIIVTLSVITSYLARRITKGPISILIKRSKNEIDDLFIKTKLIDRVSLIIPAFIVQYLAPQFLTDSPGLITFSKNFVNCYLTVIGLLIIDALLNTIAFAFQKLKASNRFAIKGFIQALKLIVNIIGVILIVSFCFDKSPTLIISSLGALTAVLLLIFKDTILGLVAGAQLSINNMVAKGDWIELPKHNADGDVIEVTLTTVKVRNWDKTISFIPAYALVAESFKNWKGMSESGGRRIKRSIAIDTNTIRFINEDEIEKFRNFLVLKSYMDQKIAELEKHNLPLVGTSENKINGRHLTNIGCFRAYCIAYLKDHPSINQELTFLVRQLAPKEKGLPIEIYVFSKDTRWSYYEAIQADIFDHLLAVLPEFGLAAYQAPAGRDIHKLNLIP
tara:strand:- start:30 stop:1268 length:1239 start_codon:yes stop_codon:yes gene_type:complete